MEAHLKGIGVENYRIFEKAQYFDFAPITLLTGANSSGKSSLIKALKFLNEIYGKYNKHIYFYKVGDLEKLFTQNKSFDFKTSPLLNTRNVLNNNSKNKVFSFHHYQYLPGVGEDIRLLIKFNYEVEDIINFKSVIISIESIKETPFTIALEKALQESKQITFEEIIGKEIVQINFDNFYRVNLKMDLDLLFFIYKEITKNSLESYEQVLKVYNQKMLFEDELKILDNQKIREKIKSYFKARNIDYEIINCKEEENIIKLGIRILSASFNREWYYTNYKDTDSDILYRYNDVLNNSRPKSWLSIDKLLAKDLEKISSFKSVLRSYYSSQIDEENENRFFEGTYKFLSCINWSNYFFLEEESPDQYWEDYNDGFKTSFINFLHETVGKGDNQILNISNKVVYGFSLYTVYNFLKVKTKKEYLDPLYSFKILKEHFYEDVDRAFFDFVLIPFLNLLSDGNKNEEPFYMQAALANAKKDFQDFSIWRDKFHCEFLQNIFTLMLKPLPSFNNVIFISNERTSSDLFFNINSARELNIFKNFNKNKDQRGLIIDILKDLDIADDISIELDNEQKTYKIILKTNDKTINLKELGYGIVKLLPILILIRPVVKRKNYYDIGNGPEKFADDEYYPTTIIIEEPESNLHPALQSKLADMFVSLSKNFNIQFIIETHSEYLIRKLQYLTAKKVIEPKDTQIHYFYHPDKKPAGETQTFPINIREDGSLTRNFGTGFFDEAGNISLELFLLNKDNQN